jgi:lipoprotein-anchoring transpeptidase ErfK/SrfK
MRTAAALIALTTLLGAAGARAQMLTVEEVNEAEFPAKGGKGISPVKLKAQVLLDRARFSPGVIDGRDGDNVKKALAAFEKNAALTADGQLDAEVWAKLSATSSEPVLIEYTVTNEDLKGPFEKKIPAKFEDMARLDRLPYTSPEELLAEKFHVTEDLLKALNPGRALDQAGTIIVPNTLAGERRDAAARAPKADEKGRVARVEVDKKARALRALDKEGKLVAFYPATIGSQEKPAPSGTFEVRAVAENPTYTYNPEYKFQGVKSDKPFKIAPGPNNPVGSVWIDITKESYGIHGTPEPDKVSKSYSHGCVRLTNWDVEELARMVEKGTQVAFIE